jgi:hypothetical protein
VILDRILEWVPGRQECGPCISQSTCILRRRRYDNMKPDCIDLPKTLSLLLRSTFTIEASRRVETCRKPASTSTDSTDVSGRSRDKLSPDVMRAASSPLRCTCWLSFVQEYDKSQSYSRASHPSTITSTIPSTYNHGRINRQRKEVHGKRGGSEDASDVRYAFSGRR